VSGVQAPVGWHWLPTQVSPAMQSPHSRLPPQLSPMLPQYLRDPTPQVAWVQLGPPTHWWLLQIQLFGQGASQASFPPQPSPTSPPQYWPPVLAHASGVHVPVGTHCLLLQTSPSMQPAQSRLPPQPSPMLPQYLRDPTPQELRMQWASPTHRWFWQPQPLGQSPHVIAAPQPLPRSPPQYWPPVGVQVSAVQAPVGTH
jgi:hypothetical protein